MIWQILYKSTSVSDHGTLQQLRNIINRRNVVSDPKTDVNSCEDFWLLVVTCHILCAAMKLLNRTSLHDFPSNAEEEWNLATVDDRRSKLYSICFEIHTKFVDLSAFSITTCTSNYQGQSKDHIQEYAKEIISLGLLYMEYKDGIREGDGDRVLNCWKYCNAYFQSYCPPELHIRVLHCFSTI